MPQRVAVGGTLDLTVQPGGLAGPNVVYTITPQPLPAHMTFNRSTGELIFVPAPNQVGHTTFTITASDGVRSATEKVPLTVTAQPRPSTEVSGQIVDVAGQPLAGVPVMIGSVATTTDSDGRFLLKGVPTQPEPLEIDGGHADATGDYMMLMAPGAQLLGHPVYADIDNVIPQPIPLPHIDIAHATDFSQVDASRTQVLTSPLLPGVSLTVAPHSAMTMDGKPFTGKLSLTALPVDKLREVLPPGVTPGGQFLGVDGPELMFETPAKLTLPNAEGYAPGTVLNLLTMNMVTGGFDVTGQLTVSADGRSLVTIKGGVTGSSCLIHAPAVPGRGDPLPPPCSCQDGADGTAASPNTSSGGGPHHFAFAPSAAAGNSGDGGSGQSAMDSDAGLVTGEYFQDHALVPHQSQGQTRTLDLQYSSLQADPRPVLQFEPSVQPSDSLDYVSITEQADLAGVNQGSNDTYTPPSTLARGDSYRVDYQADATALSSGPYSFHLTVTNNYSGGTALSSDYASTVDVVNAASGPLGAGWSIGGIQHLYAASPTTQVMIADGSGSPEPFDYRPGGPVNDVAIIGSDGTARMLSNDGMGNLTVPASGTAAAASPVGVAAGDFNGDGKSDLAEVAGSAVIILLANASGGFTLGSSYTLAASALAVATGNFTGHTNGTLDLTVLGGNGTVTVLPGTGTGTFSTASETVTSLAGGAITATTGSMVSADFNSDGKADLAVATTGDGDLQVLLGNGGGGFATPVEYALASGSQTFVTIGDFNGDGKPDLASANSDIVTMMVGNGSGGFTAAGTTEPFLGAELASLTAGDFYGNGQVDLAMLIADPISGVMGYAIIPGSPSGSWGNAVLSSIKSVSGQTPEYAAAADLNGDGRPDLALGYDLLALATTNPDANQMEPAQAIDAAGNQVAVVAAAPFTGRSQPASYAPEMGDTSSLVHNGDGTWTRSYPDGTVIHFNTGGQETSETDRNGNTTSYAYVASGAAAGALQTITDPVGLVTTLAYDAGGHLSTITDPAGRVTTFTMDASGNLTRIVDPDGAVTQYGYATPTNHRITTETNPDNHTATAHYDSSGRLTSETLFDGTSSVQVGSAQERGLLAPGGSGALPMPGGYQGTVTDANGHTTTLTFDAMSHATASTDATGQTTNYTRNMDGWPTAITDPLNRTTSFAYDMKGNVTSVTRPGGSSMTIQYDPTFNVPTQVTDFRGLTTTFTLDSHGNVTRRTDPDLGHEDYTYNAAGQVLTDTDRNGHTTSYAYDSYGRLTTITYPGTGAPAVHFGYDAAGDVTSATDELGHTTTYTYDQAGRVLSSQDPVQAAAGKCTIYTYDAAGNLTSVTDALNHTTTYAYDARNRLTGVTDPVNQGTGRQTAYTYDSAGNLLSVTDPLGHATTFGYDADNRRTTVTDALNHTTTYTYDADGELTAVTDANGNTTSYTYDELGRLQTETLPGTAPDGSGTQVPVTTTYGYDADGNRTDVTDAMGDVTSYAYDNLNRQTSVSTHPSTTDTITVSFGYDAAGNPTTVTDGLGHVTSYAYDARDQLVSSTEPTGGGTTTYSYDLASRLTSLTDPDNNVTSYGYDAAGRKTTVTDPRGKVTSYVYDLAGNLTQKTDRDGRVRQFAHDADDRETTESWLPTGGGSPINIITMTYDAAGHETGISDNSSHYAFGYDNANQLTSVDDSGTPGLPHAILTYTYDNVGNRTSLTDSLGGVNSYTYDVRDELTSLTQSGSGVASKRVDFAYDAAGRLTSLTRYSDLAGTSTVLVTAYTYDGANRLTNLAHETALTGGTVVASYGYTLDDANRVTQETRTWGSGASSDMVGYTYTNNDQLTGVTHTNGSFANESFSYDTNGNQNSTGYTTATGNRLASDGTYNYAYDDEGNLTSKTEISSGNQTLYTWDYRNRLTEVDQVVGGVHSVVATYTYDALDRQIGVSENGSTTWTAYDDQSPILDFNGLGAQTARYLQGPAVDEILARETSSGVAWYLVDRLGSIGEIVDNSGVVIDHIDYSAFGQKLNETAPSVGDRFKFAGLAYDSATSLNFAVHRVADPVAGRWISEDPVGFSGSDSNFYRFVHNDPLLLTDPSGLAGRHPVTSPRPPYDPSKPSPPTFDHPPECESPYKLPGDPDYVPWDVVDKCIDKGDEEERRLMEELGIDQDDPDWYEKVFEPAYKVTLECLENWKNAHPNWTPNPWGNGPALVAPNPAYPGMGSPVSSQGPAWLLPAEPGFILPQLPSPQPVTESCPGGNKGPRKDRQNPQRNPNRRNPIQRPVPRPTFR